MKLALLCALALVGIVALSGCSGVAWAGYRAVNG